VSLSIIQYTIVCCTPPVCRSAHAGLAAPFPHATALRTAPPAAREDT
jgi:hypothetical protein